MTVINYIRLIQYKSVFLLEILVPYDNIRIAKFEINPSTLYQIDNHFANLQPSCLGVFLGTPSYIYRYIQIVTLEIYRWEN